MKKWSCEFKQWLAITLLTECLVFIFCAGAFKEGFAAPEVRALYCFFAGLAPILTLVTIILSMMQNKMTDGPLFFPTREDLEQPVTESRFNS